MEVRPLRLFRNLGRTAEIVTVLLRHGFGEFVEQLHLRRYLPWMTRRRVRQVEGVSPGVSTARRIRLTLEELGPTFIKFGQVMSTRPDLVPPEVIAELEHLQEQVPPFPSQEALHVVEHDLRGTIRSLFAEFDEAPLAAGSLGQVHCARHEDGTRLAVKIRRPEVVRHIERDLSLMRDLATLIEGQIPGSDVFDPVGLVHHFSRTIRREMNFLREARALEEFRRLFAHDATLYVPKVYHDLSTDAVLTMEFVDGCRADDLVGVARLAVSPHQLAANGANIFMKMAFEHGVFHGDPHPGNIRIRSDGSIALIDYGMIGYLDDAKREHLTDLFVGIAQHDVSRTVALVKIIGKPSRAIDEPLLRADVQDFVETYYGVPLERLKVGNLLSDFVGLLANHGLRCPADLSLLIRAIVTLEGVGRTLDPSFNLAGELAPFVERLVRKRYDPKYVMDRTWRDARRVFHAVHDLPMHLGNTLEKLSRDDLKVQLEHRSLDRLITEFDRSSNRVVVGLVTASLIVATALIIRSQGASLWITIPIFLLSGFLGIWLVYGILRSGRL